MAKKQTKTKSESEKTWMEQYNEDFHASQQKIKDSKQTSNEELDNTSNLQKKPTQTDTKIELAEIKEALIGAFTTQKDILKEQLSAELKEHVNYQLSMLGSQLSQVIETTRKDKQTELLIEQIPRLKGEANAILENYIHERKYKHTKPITDGEWWTNAEQHFIIPMQMVLRKMIDLLDQLDEYNIADYIDEKRRHLPEDEVEE